MPHIVEPPSVFEPPKPVKDARTMLWIQVVTNAFSLALFFSAFFPAVAETSDDVRLVMNLIGLLSILLMAAMVVTAALILKRLAWVYVLALGIQALSILVIVLNFKPSQFLGILVAGYISVLLLRAESRRWFFPPKTA